MRLLLVLLCLVLANSDREQYHNKHLKHLTQEKFQLHEEHIRRNLQLLTRNAIRITVNDLSLNAVTTTTTSAVLTFLSKAMKVVKQFVTARFKVSPENSNNIANSMCVDFTTPANDRSSGIALSDLHIYISYVTDKTLQYTATGKYCKVSAGSTSSPNPDTTLARGRPTMGRIKFNTAYALDGAQLTNRLFADTTASTLSEMIHIMGFDSDLYGTFLDSTTNNTYVAAVMQSATGLSAGRVVNKMITTPNVKAWAKDWFDCPGITGMLLENEAVDGNNYWQRTLMYDEIMTKTPLGAQRGISGLTYAFLKDMGWYFVDDTFNDTTPFGYKKGANGCSFFYSGCNSSTVFDEFCDSTQVVKSCTSQSFSKGVCQVNPYSDKCGIWVSTLNCVDADAQDDGWKTQSQEAYGTTSFCVSSTLASVGIDSNLQSRCYQYVCYDNNAIKFIVGGNTILCSPTDAGTPKTLSGFAGSLTCPSYKNFCWMSRKLCPNWCSQNGFCTRGVCNCLPGYAGEDCSKTICTTATHKYNPGTTACVTSCPSSTYSNYYSFTCMPCVNCTQCVSESTVCTSCVGGTQVMYNGVCYNACPAQTYLNGSVCVDCVAPCFNCTSNTTSTCTSCTTGLYLSTPTTGTCAANCTNLVYQMQDTVNYKCVSSCLDNLVQVGVSTCQKCPSGQYKNTSNLCNETCPSGYYPDNTNDRRFCGLCDTSCQTCIDVYAQNCTSCWSNATNKYLYLGQCVFNVTCPTGTYADDPGLTCRSCPASLNCSSCVNTTSNVIVCVKCAYGWHMNSSGFCDVGCASNQYANKGNNSCVSCNAACVTCTSGTNSSCTSCIASKVLLTNTTGGYCLTACPTIGYYNNSGQCIPCYSSCLTCIGGLISNCTSCSGGMFLWNGHCYDACPSSTYKDNATSTCLVCNTTCTFCYGPLSTNCTKCTTGYFLANTSCVTSCPTGQSINQWSVCVFTRRLALSLISLLLFGFAL